MQQVIQLRVNRKESSVHLWEHITRFGPPRFGAFVREWLNGLLGREWLNGVVKSLTSLVGTDHFVTRAYGPSTNGLQEREFYFMYSATCFLFD